MIKKKMPALIVISPLMIGALFSTAAQAELYVSPVAGDPTTSVVQDPAPYVKVEDHEIAPIGGVSRPGDELTSAPKSFLVKPSNDVSTRFGHNVPLHLAIEHIIPNPSSWNINIDEDIGIKPVSWSGGSTWQGDLKSIEDNSGLSIAINHQERSIGVAIDAEIAIALASRDVTIWRLDSRKSLRDNLEYWANNSEWSLYWDEKIKGVNYPVVADAQFRGKIHGRGGVIDRLLKNTAQIPLAADFYYGNKVIHIRPAGYEQEVKF